MNLKRGKITGKSSLRTRTCTNMTQLAWLHTETWQCILHLSWWLNMKNWFQDVRKEGDVWQKLWLFFRVQTNSGSLKNFPRASNTIKIVWTELNNSQINCRTNWDTRKRELKAPSRWRVIFHQFSHVEHDWWVKIYCDLHNLCSLALPFSLGNVFHSNEKISKTINPNNDEYKLTINYALNRQQRPLDFEHKENDNRDVMDQRRRIMMEKVFLRSCFWDGISRCLQGSRAMKRVFLFICLSS